MKEKKYKSMAQSHLWYI